MRSPNNFCVKYIKYTLMKFSLLLYIGQRHITILGSPDGESLDESLVDLVSIESCSTAELQNTAFNMYNF